jgi:hypothetical protein
MRAACGPAKRVSEPWGCGVNGAFVRDCDHPECAANACSVKLDLTLAPPIPSPEELRGTGPSAAEVHANWLRDSWNTRDLPGPVFMPTRKRMPRIVVCPTWDEVIAEHEVLTVRHNELQSMYDAGTEEA